MKDNYFILLIILILFSACKKSELSPSYTVDFSNTAPTITVSTNDFWIDTIYYNILPFQNEECVASLIGFSEYENENYYSSSSDNNETQYSFGILAQTNKYLVYKASPLESIEEGFELDTAHLIITANAQIVGQKIFTVKTTTNKNITPTSVISDNDILYIKESTSLEKRNINTGQSTLLNSFPYSVAGFSVTSNKQDYVVASSNSYHYHYTFGQTNENNNGYASSDFIGINKDEQTYYSSGNYVYTYSNFSSYTTSNTIKLVSGSSYYYDLISVAASSSNTFYYIERYKENGINSTFSSFLDYYKIKSTSGNVYLTEHVSTTSYLKDLVLSDDETKLAFVENSRTLKVLDLKSNHVSTIYTITSGTISSPDFNTNSTKLAFSLYTGGQYDIYTISTSGTNVNNVTSTIHTNEFMPQW